MIHSMNDSVNGIILGNGLTGSVTVEANRFPAVPTRCAGIGTLRRAHTRARADPERRGRTPPAGPYPRAEPAVPRVRSRADRRNYELRLTAEGTKALGTLRGVAERHEAELLAPLTREESAQLESLLARLASAHALDTELHRDMSADRATRRAAGDAS